jgi:poly-gamma-glutamate synthesis protein (capsule biosynthesis protein)
MGLKKRFLSPEFTFFLCLSVFIIAACGLLDSLAISSSPAGESLPSPTPFQPLVTTPTPQPLTVWISPAVPDALRERVESAVGSEPASIQIGSQENAVLKIQPNGEFWPVEWIYALAAPFPTLRDQMDSSELTAIWGGAQAFSETIYVSNSTLYAVGDVLGGAADDHVVGVSGDTLIDVAWSDRPSLAIVPFEELEPRWKVITLDGQSPLRREFTADDYLLRIHFGLSGASEDVERFLRLVDWPRVNRDPTRLTILAMTGVTALTRGTAAKMELHGVDYPGLLIGDWLRNADLTHVSNEVSFDKSCPTPDPYSTKMRFCSAPEYLTLLEDVGVDLVELTGNHIADWGDEALLYTLDLYEQREWQTFGGGRNLAESLQAVTIEHNGNQIAFLGCNISGPYHAWATEDTPGAAPCQTGTLYAEIDRLRAEGYLVVFTFQWFEGSTLLPAQQDAFREVVEAGAVIVSGSQAHQPLGFEFYGNGFIHYGLGNLFFDQMQSLALRQEFIDLHIFYDGRYINTELRTALLEDYAQPRPMSEEERLGFLTDIFKKSNW